MAHVLPDTARVNAKEHLEIGGCDTVELSREYGTPLYVFDETTLRNRCRAFLEEFRRRHPNTAVLYACKAFTNTALLRIFQTEGLGLDVVSGGELAAARAVSFPPERIYFHGNNKSPQELQESLGYGIGRIVVDNLHELEVLEKLAAQAGKTQPILLRLTPGIDPHTHAHTTTGVLDSKFGIPVATGEAAEAVGRALACEHLELVGLHFHLGSPIFELEPYALALRVVIEFAAGLADRGLWMEELSPGGGFAIAYTRDQRPPSIGQYAEAITSTLKGQAKTLGLPLPRLVIEPGRAIVGPAGVALYTVGAVKEIPGIRKYVAVDGGMGDNIRPALYGARYEVLAANRMGEEVLEPATIAGKYCESGDILARDALLPRLAPGDVVALPAAGAYCPSMASTYNHNGRPAMVLVKSGQARLIRRRETYEDLLRNDVV
ncbi:MAG: diaminopimelate decarboxylase [Chloroflexi bacterium]|nr:diaminopimelate decarboxylase [Chloroflexota bacterium]